MTRQFAHLHTHTEYSMLDGAAKVRALLNKAVALGQPAVASTDHGNVFSHYEMWKTAKEMREKEGADITFIAGCELYVAPASRLHKAPVFWGSRGNTGSKGDSDMKDVSGAGAYTHMTMLATNGPGLNALFELTSRASIEGAYAKVGSAKPRIDAELLAEVLDNWPGAQLVGTTGCPSGAVQTRLRLGQWDKALEEAAVWRDILGEGNYFVELMDHGNDFEAASRPQLMELAKEMRLPLLATNDSHYVEPTQSKMHDALLCLQMGKKLSDTDRMKFDGSGYHLRSAKEMRDLFKELPDACDNTLEIADRVTADAYDEVLSYKDDLLPEFPVPEGYTPGTYLRERVMIGLKQKYPDPEGPEGITQEAWDRVPGCELPLIQKMGYSSYMLMVWDFTNWARERGIRKGPGRGSAAGSATSYALDITDVPTLENGLLFERFINPERVSPPDVDIDFEKRRRDEIFRYLAERWGEDKVCRIQTLGTIKAKAALKDAGRVLGMAYGLGEKLTKAFPKAISGFEAPLACVEDKEHPRYADAQDLRDLLEKEDGARAVFDLASELEGLIRSTGVHACGFVVSSRPLMGRIPLVWSEKDHQMVSGFPNADVLEPMGYLKVDVLGLDTMDVITLAADMIRDRHGVEVDEVLDKLDDPAAYRELSSGHTVGMFQVASSGMAKLLSMMQADRFEDISAGLALYRPGPMGADAHTTYALRKVGKERIRPIHPELEVPLKEILDPTYGVICYQEQVMSGAQKVAGYSLAKADLLRKAMGKKKPEVLAKEFIPFSDGMKENGFSPEATKALWDILIPFSAYAFNRCISGETDIARLGRGSHAWPQTAENVANRLHGREDFHGQGCRYCYNEAGRVVRYGSCTACKSWRDKWKANGGMNAAGRVDDRVLPVKIVDVFRQGIKPLWKMTLANGMTLTSTMNHRHLTPTGWAQLRELAVGDEVSVMGDGEWNQPSPRTDVSGTGPDWVGEHGYYVAERAHGKAGPLLHGRHAEFQRNTKELERACAKCGSTEGRLERAHLDGDPMNNAADNLAILCNSCHKKHDYANGGRTKMWRKGRAIESSVITSIKYVGEKMTYDVTVDSEDHSWVANGGIITHNSHTVSYGYITYATAYLKAHYPAEFMAALLTMAGDDKKKLALYLGETRRMGLKVYVPDVNEASPNFSPTDDGVRFGLNAVSGLGPKAVDGIIAAREERPFRSFADFLDRIPDTTCTKGAVKALIRGGGFDSLGHSRRALDACYEDGVGAYRGDKKKKAEGQFDLFSATPEVDFQAVIVPDLPEWDDEEKLAHERKALGTWVSGHPLTRLAAVLAGNRTITLAELATDEPSEGTFQISGQIVDIQTKTAKASGNPYAIIGLEDLTGRTELRVMGRSYGEHRHLLTDDRRVTVKVYLKTDMKQRPGGEEYEETSVLVATIDDLDMDKTAEERDVREPKDLVLITVDPANVTRDLVYELKGVLQDYPGNRPVWIKLTRESGPELFNLPGFNVADSVALRSELKGIRGLSGVRF